MRNLRASAQFIRLQSCPFLLCNLLSLLFSFILIRTIITSDKRQSKTLLNSTSADETSARNNVFDCHLSPVGRKMAIENSVFNNIYLHSSIVLTFSISAYPVLDSAWLLACCTEEPVLSGHSKVDKTRILIANESLLKVESIAECPLEHFLQYFDLH